MQDKQSLEHERDSINSLRQFFENAAQQQKRFADDGYAKSRELEAELASCRDALAEKERLVFAAERGVSEAQQALAACRDDLEAAQAQAAERARERSDAAETAQREADRARKLEQEAKVGCLGCAGVHIAKLALSVRNFVDEGELASCWKLELLEKTNHVPCPC